MGALLPKATRGWTPLVANLRDQVGPLIPSSSSTLRSLDEC